MNNRIRICWKCMGSKTGSDRSKWPLEWRARRKRASSSWKCRSIARRLSGRTEKLEQQVRARKQSRERNLYKYINLWGEGSRTHRAGRATQLSKGESPRWWRNRRWRRSGSSSASRARCSRTGRRRTSTRTAWCRPSRTRSTAGRQWRPRYRAIASTHHQVINSS